MMNTAVRVIYEGRVQGVGFRYQTRQIAAGFSVVGTVENLADGRVRMEVMGEQEEVNAFLEEIRQSDLASFIRNETSEIIPLLTGVRGFSIVR